MWYQHALHPTADYVAHQPAAFVPHHSIFAEQIRLTIDVVSVTW
jgi:hypothetical protein